eukprot:GDKH01004271.1.p1 GENE.GDKH01004271.1~~GDKH01004271.1.p1  ORF type:complete len:107 (-),score=20.10 GDKH01004271.1:54-374(-)
MPVVHLKSEDEFKQVIAKDQVVCVDFFAEWCGPCKLMAPKIEAMSEEFPDVVFAKLDVDELEAISEGEDVSAMPTFIFYKDGKRLDTYVGANDGGLRAVCERLRSA